MRRVGKIMRRAGKLMRRIKTFVGSRQLALSWPLVLIQVFILLFIFTQIDLQRLSIYVC